MTKIKNILKSISSSILGIIILFAIIFVLMGTWHLLFNKIPYFPTIFATSFVSIFSVSIIILIYKFGKDSEEKLTWKSRTKIIAIILGISLIVSQIPDLCNYEDGYCSDMPIESQIKLFVWVFFAILIAYFFGRSEK